MLAEARRVVRRAGLMHVGVEEVRWGGVLVRLSHHAGLAGGEVLLAVAKERGVELRLACCRREDGKVGVAKGGRKEIGLLLLLRVRREVARVWRAEGGGVGLDLVGKALGQVEGRDGGGVREAGVGEWLRYGLLVVAQEAGGVHVIGRVVGLGDGVLLERSVDKADTETDG